jgi:hypothetical protein
MEDLELTRIAPDDPASISDSALVVQQSVRNRMPPQSYLVVLDHVLS